jgi:ketosteroid isomerase-like protein
MSKTYFLATAVLIATLPEIALPAVAQNGAAYRVSAEYKLQGSGAVGDLWLDVPSRRLFVARADRVDVLSADSGQSEGSMTAKDAAGIVVVDSASRGFFANRGSGTISMFDTASLAILKTIPLEVKSPESLVYDADARRVFAIAAGEVVALNSVNGEMEGRVSLQGHLRDAVSNGMGSLFIAAQDMHAVHVVDTHSLRFLGDIPSGDADGPVSLAIDPSGRRLFVACSEGKLAVIDTDIGFTFEELPIASGDAASLFTFTPQGKGGWKGADFIAGDTGTLTLIQMNAFIRYSLGGKVSIPKGVHAVAYDSRTHRIFLSVSTPHPEVLTLSPAFAEVTQ